MLFIPANGLGPLVEVDQVQEDKIIQYSFDSKGRGQATNDLGESVGVSLYELVLTHIPTAKGSPAPNNFSMSYAINRGEGIENYQIPKDQLILDGNTSDRHNNLLVLSRM